MWNKIKRYIMKKIFSILLVCAMLTLCLSACTTTSTTPSIDSSSPWGITTGTYEKSTYSISVNEYLYEDGEYTLGDELASGTYSQEIENVLIDNIKSASATSSLSVDWNDNEKALTNQNKSDSFESAVSFAISNNTPISSSKTATIQDRTDSDGNSMDNYSYTYATDYDSKKATILFGKESDDSEDYLDKKTVDISSLVNFDNEQLFYTLRAFSDYELGSYVSFNLFNAIDAYQYGDDHYHTMVASVAEEMQTVTLDDFILSYTESAELDCMVISLQINSYDMGSIHKFYITDTETTFSSGSEVLITNKLITKYEYASLSFDSEENFLYTYTLSDYTTSKA